VYLEGTLSSRISPYKKAGLFLSRDIQWMDDTHQLSQEKNKIKFLRDTHQVSQEK
jgi:hypothetical protein